MKYLHDKRSCANLTFVSCALLFVAAATSPALAAPHTAPIMQRKDAAAPTQASFALWKRRYLKQGRCNPKELYVDSSGDAGQPGDITVSEAHGYGMLLLVGLDDEDGQARWQFDAMVNLLQRLPTSAELPLMAWRVRQDCTVEPHTVSAPDGDIDIAYALLLAEARWGASGAHNYRALALRHIDALMQHVVQQKEGGAPIMGLWQDIGDDDPYAGGTRLSDYITGHFKAFYGATRDRRWCQLVEHGYRIMAQLQQQSPYSLLPDFALVNGDDVRAAPAGFLEGENDGAYGYNACRVPWRLAADYVTSHDPRAAARLAPLTQGLLRLTQRDPHALYDGYTLAGEATGTKVDRMAFVAPLNAALWALGSPQRQVAPWDTALRQAAASSQGYYNDTLYLLQRTLLAAETRKEEGVGPTLPHAP